MRILSTGVMAISFAWAVTAPAQFREGQVVRGFRLPEYDAAGALKYVVTGDAARAVASDVFEITNLKIELMKDGVVETRVTAPLCMYNRRNNEARSDGSVRIVRGDVVITGEGFAWNGAESHFRIERNARVVLRNIRLDSAQEARKP